MNYDIIVYIVIGLFAVIAGFICLVVWLIGAGLNSKYKEEQEALDKTKSS